MEARVGGRAAHEGRSVNGDVGIVTVSTDAIDVREEEHLVRPTERPAHDAGVGVDVARAVAELRHVPITVLVEAVEMTVDVDAVLEELLAPGQRTAVGGKRLGLRNGGVEAHAVTIIDQDLDRDLLTVDLGPVILDHGTGRGHLGDLVEEDPIARLRNDVVAVPHRERRAHTDEKPVLVAVPHDACEDHGGREDGEDGAKEEQIGTDHGVTWGRRKSRAKPLLGTTCHMSTMPQKVTFVKYNG